MSKFIRWIVVAVLLVAGGALAASDNTAAVKKLLEKKFPGINASHVVKSPYFGLYEIMAGDQLIYTDAKVKYIIIGSVIDTDNRVNLSEEKLAKMRAIAWSALPLELAIKTVKGDGSRQLAVFADADCPYCRRLESEFKKIDNVTIYTFLYPIDQLHPDSNQKSKKIWCATDREKAWNEWIVDSKLPDNDGKCDTPLATVAALGAKFHVSATPTIVFSNGHVVPGALPVAQLEHELSASEAADAAPAAAVAKKAETTK
jgi:thiol:disulfide interchange protein DsbC